MEMSKSSTWILLHLSKVSGDFWHGGNGGGGGGGGFTTGGGVISSLVDRPVIPISQYPSSEAMTVKPINDLIKK